tara:strand:+ start:23 stop:190 length:168 start_codon:yes stop_codon:yes gene_type:complete
MIFLSKPSVFFLPGTWEAQEPIAADSTNWLATIGIVLLILYWAVYILPKKMRRDN